MASSTACLEASGLAPGVNDTASGCEFRVNLIRHTVQHTTLRRLAAGHAVNLEVDTIARYVERMLGIQSSERA